MDQRQLEQPYVLLPWHLEVWHRKLCSKRSQFQKNVRDILCPERIQSAHRHPSGLQRGYPKHSNEAIHTKCDCSKAIGLSRLVLGSSDMAKPPTMATSKIQNAPIRSVEFHARLPPRTLHSNLCAHEFHRLYSNQDLRNISESSQPRTRAHHFEWTNRRLVSRRTKLFPRHKRLELP